MTFVIAGHTISNAPVLLKNKCVLLPHEAKDELVSALRVVERKYHLVSAFFLYVFDTHNIQYPR